MFQQLLLHFKSTRSETKTTPFEEELEKKKLRERVKWEINAEK